MKITLDNFQGAFPLMPPLGLAPSQAQVAESCRSDEGFLRPLRGTPEWARTTPLEKLGDLGGVYRYSPTAGLPDSGYVFHWAARTQVAAGFIRGDSQKAVAFTTAGLRPQITDATISTLTTDYPSQAYWLGVPAPTSAPVATLDTGVSNHVLTTADGVSWAEHASAADISWHALCWSPALNLFCAIAYTGTGNRVMTSPDGVTWTTRTTPSDNAWYSICWSPALNLFCAVAYTGTGDRVMTSPDGITWTTRVSAADNSWRSVCWSPELSLFCAVAVTGTGNRVMTSPDGIAWTIRVSAANNAWQSVCWAPTLLLFCAVASTGTGNRVMTSPDGIVWTTRTNPADNDWQAVTWSPDLALFCAVATSGTGNRVMTSTDGIAWTGRTSAADNVWQALVWVPDLALFYAVSNTGVGTRVMTSPDGRVWTTRTGVADYLWSALCWSPGLHSLCALATTDSGDDKDRAERNYVLTFESYWTTQRFEGPPAQDGDGKILFSNTVNPLPGQPVILTNLPTAPTGDWNVTHVGIFRVSGTKYRRVGRVPVGTDHFVDAVAETGLGEVLASSDFYPPVADMHHIGVLSNGMAYGASGNNVCISYPYLIHAWGPNNRYPLPRDVMAVCHVDSTIYAFTQDNPYVLSGQDPRSMYVSEVPVGQGCASALSVCVSRFGVVYASAEGLYLLRPGNQPRNLTAPFLLLEQWRAYKPSSFMCGVFENWLLAFWNNGTDKGCLLFRLDVPDFGIVNIPNLEASALYADPLMDALVIVPPYDGIQNKMLLFQGSNTPTSNYRWRSGLLKTVRPTTFKVGRVWSRDYVAGLTLRLYDQDGALRHTQTVTDSGMFRLPGDYTALAIAVELEGQQEVMRVDLAESAQELAK